MSMFVFLYFGTGAVIAQNQQQVETAIGTVAPDQGGYSGGSGGDDGLSAGELLKPLSKGFSYLGSTYPDHTAWSVDFNRGAVGADYGDPVFASADGEVSLVYPDNGGVWIRHEGGYTTAYAHFSKTLVRAGQKVKACQKIGEIGDTYWDKSKTIGSHLHLQHCTASNCIHTGSIKMKFMNNDYPASLPAGSSIALPGKYPITGSCTD